MADEIGTAVLTNDGSIVIGKKVCPPKEKMCWQLIDSGDHTGPAAARVRIWLGVAFTLSLCAVCQAQTANNFTPGEIATNSCWINSATGQRVPTFPPGYKPGLDDPNHSSIPGHGLNFVRLPDGNWINSATGNPVPTFPPGYKPGLDDPNHSSIPGHGLNFVRIPCPPSQTATGLYIGGEVVKNWGLVRSTERLAATDVVTNQFSDRADPFGGGLIVGYKFAPWANNVIVSPFASFDFIKAPVNHTFAGGSFLGTTANFMGTAGVKVGPQLDMGLWLYGIAGASVLNETLNINFIPVASSTSATVAGATLGLGGAWQPAFLQGFGRPVSLFLEYQHTWWQDANFNTPAASPLFNYTFARQDDVVKFGFTVPISASPPALPPPIIHK